MIHEGKRIKIHEARIAPDTEKPAETLFSQSGKLFLACGESTCLELTKVQLEGKKTVAGSLFLL